MPGPVHLLGLRRGPLGLLLRALLRLGLEPGRIPGASDELRRPEGNEGSRCGAVAGNAL